MIRLNHFLGCIRLEIFGLVIGWLNFISWCIITVITCVLAVLAFIKYDDPGYGLLVLIVATVFAYIAYVSKQLIDGVNDREPEKIEGFKTFTIFVLIFQFMSLFLIMYLHRKFYSEQEGSTLLLILKLVVSVLAMLPVYYLLICVHSLMLKLKDDNRKADLLNNSSIPKPLDSLQVP